MSYKHFLLTIGVLFFLATMVTARVVDEDAEELDLEKMRFAARNFDKPRFQARNFEKARLQAPDLKERNFDARAFEAPLFSARDILKFLAEKRMFRSQKT